MKRIRWVVLLPLAVIMLAALVWLVVGNSLLATRSDDTWQRIRRERVLRVCIDATYPPFETSGADGALSGYDIDLSRALAERWQADLQFVTMHFDGLYAALSSGKCDLVISALPYDRTLTRDVLYSSPYMQLGQVLLVAQGETEIDSWHSLDGSRVAVELGSEAHQLLRQVMRDTGQVLEIATEREPAEALARLLAGRAQALVVDSVTAFSYLGQHPQLKQVGDLQDAIPLVIAANRDAPFTIEQVNEALLEFGQNGLLEQLRARWF